MASTIYDMWIMIWFTTWWKVNPKRSILHGDKPPILIHVRILPPYTVVSKWPKSIPTWVMLTAILLPNSCCLIKTSRKQRLYEIACYAHTVLTDASWFTYDSYVGIEWIVDLQESWHVCLNHVVCLVWLCEDTMGTLCCSLMWTWWSWFTFVCGVDAGALWIVEISHTISS